METIETTKRGTKALITALLCFIMLFCSVTLIAVEADDKKVQEPGDSKAYEKLPYNRQVLLEKINRRLDKLQMSYVSQLYKSERHEAQIILDEIRKVANLLAYTAELEAPKVVVKTVTIVEPGDTVYVVQKPPPPPPQPHIRAMSEKDFISLKQSIRKNNFGDSGLNTLRSAAEENHFKSSQVVEILSLFVFSDDKQKALAIAYPKCLDTQNKYKILDSFMFDSDKRIAQEIMDRKKK